MLLWTPAGFLLSACHYPASWSCFSFLKSIIGIAADEVEGSPVIRVPIGGIGAIEHQLLSLAKCCNARKPVTFASAVKAGHQFCRGVRVYRPKACNYQRHASRNERPRDAG